MTGCPPHISISGDLGSGKSAVAGTVASELGFRLVSTGDIQRRMAQELEVSTLEANFLAETDRSIDEKVDGVTTQLGRESADPIVFDSRMAWKMVSNSLKVRLVVDPEVAAERALLRSAEAESYASLDEARAMLHNRFESEARRFLGRYGVDITSTRHYDLVIDTSDASIEDVTKAVIDHYRNSVPGHAVFASAKRMIPISPRPTDVWPVETAGEVPVLYVRPFFVSLGHHSELQRFITLNEPFTNVRVVAQGQEEIAPDTTAEEFARTRITPEVTRSWQKITGQTFDSYWSWVAGS